jgi:hypothetical protein
MQGGNANIDGGFFKSSLRAFFIASMTSIHEKHWKKHLKGDFL